MTIKQFFAALGVSFAVTVPAMAALAGPPLDIRTDLDRQSDARPASMSREKILPHHQAVAATTPVAVPPRRIVVKRDLQERSVWWPPVVPCQYILVGYPQGADAQVCVD